MQNLSPGFKNQGFRVLVTFVLISVLLTACLGDNDADENQNQAPQATQSVLTGTQTPSASGRATATSAVGANPSGSASTPAAGGSPPSGNAVLATVTPVPGASGQTTATQTGQGRVPVTGQSQAMALQNEYVRLYQQANPGVVNIRVEVSNGAQSGVGTGSGWIYDTQGHIVTNNHVVADGANLIVTFFDSFQEIAEVVGLDPYSDLAVIKVKQLPQNVHPMKTATKDETRVGDLVVAIGSPFGLGSTMTTGIISALGRDIPSLASNYSIPQVIQTDASINPGNSGGPLINLNGEVIGVNSQIATGGSNQSSGVGFAVPASIVNQVVPGLISQGQYTWPYLGVSGTTVDLAIQQANRLEAQQGAYIDDVVRGGPADQAKLRGSNGTANVMGVQMPKGGDVVIAMDGQPTISYDQLLGQIAMHKPGDTVTLTILRDGKKMDVAVKLGSRPAGNTNNLSGGSGPIR